MKETVECFDYQPFLSMFNDSGRVPLKVETCLRLSYVFLIQRTVSIIIRVGCAWLNA